MRIEYDENGNPKVIRSEHKEQPDETKKTPNKFYSIPYLQAKCLDTFSSNEIVWIEEKIDGTNVSCEIDNNNNYRCYGRRYELGTWYTNRGAYEKLLELEKVIRDVASPNLVLYFEYLTLHHVRYSEDKENKLYLIGIKDKVLNKYYKPSMVYTMAKMIGVETPKCLYHGCFRDWSIAKNLVGTSAFGAAKGEGVIVKAYDDTKGIKMVKIVADDFREIMKYDPSRVEDKLNKEITNREKAKTVVTDARIRKQLLEMVDEGILDSIENMSKEQKSIAIKNIGKRIYNDCIKEEPEFVVEFGKEFGKYSFLLSKQFIENL